LLRATVASVATRAVLLAAALCAGCKSDLSQQLLERELRMQEDQIYQLQDELEAKCARLERVAGENTSLRRQLGFADGDVAAPAPRTPLAPRSLLAPPSGQPTLVPPPLTIPGVPASGGGAASGGGDGRLPPPISIPSAPGGVAPPKLEGVPPLPSEPRLPGAAAPAAATVLPAAAAMPATADVDPGARPIAPAPVTDARPPAGKQLSHEESLAEAGKITHLVINQSRTECFDGTGDGLSDGIAVVIEPRDDDERLVAAAGDVVIAVIDDRGGPVARWDIPSQEAFTHFRRTSRNRGLHFVLHWPGQPPQGTAVRLLVKLTCFDGASFETDCTVATQPNGAAGGPR
jgi:hypothetical protein